ncbi:MAG: hypothetical protein E7287_09285 [Lachnospiraceae bacterium]|nr:hypothetical protein [Lachnospiraceae bacterium]
MLQQFVKNFHSIVVFIDEFIALWYNYKRFCIKINEKGETKCFSILFILSSFFR